MTEQLHLHPEVEAAISKGAPVVALESTIITHGMPWPDNLNTAREVEQVVRNCGVIPATIAVLEGRLEIGLNAEQLEQLAQATDVMKLSRADLPACMALGRDGSTTVAATMIAASLAGIGVFATGGIGGVHRGVNKTLDISADLNELSQTAVNVVCAGAKAILDIPRTLEYLETAGVPVIGWRCDELPAFWSRSSGIKTPLRFDEVAELARFIELRKTLGLKGGALITNPVPLDAEIPAIEMRQLIEDALHAAKQQGISGKQVTPFLLGDILKRSGGRSLTTNIELIKNNAQLASQLAVELGSKSASTVQMC